MSDTGGVEGFGIDENDAIAKIGYVSNDSISEDGYETDDEDDGVEGFGIDDDDAVADIGYVSDDSTSEDGYEAYDERFDNGHHGYLSYDEEIEFDLRHQEFNRHNGDVIDSLVYNQIPLDLVNPDEILENNNFDASDRGCVVDDEFDDNYCFNDHVNPDQILENNCVDINGYDADNEWGHSDDDHDGYLDGDDV